MKKAIVVTYDDMVILDETEIEYSSNKQLFEFAKDIFISDSNAQSCEIYDKNTRVLIVEMKKTRGGRITTSLTEDYPREKKKVIPRKPENECKRFCINLPIRKEMKEHLDTLGRNNRAEFIRTAIKEKWLRDKNQPIESEIPKPEPKDKRFSKIFRDLPSDIKVYFGYELTHEPLTIIKLGQKSWRVSYGEPTDEEDSPCFIDENLLNALEHLQDWLVKHNKKWIRK